METNDTEDKVAVHRSGHVVSDHIEFILKDVVDTYRKATVGLNQLEREVLALDLVIGLDTLLEMVDAGCANRAMPLQ